MERLVLFLCGLWFWLTRKSRSLYYRRIVEELDAARDYLLTEYYGCWSTRDRGFLLASQIEALTILEHQRALLSYTSRRFESLTDCCQMVAEELAGPPKAA